jgi:hypothetical protein
LVSFTVPIALSRSDLYTNDVIALVIPPNKRNAPEIEQSFIVEVIIIQVFEWLQTHKH